MKIVYKNNFGQTIDFMGPDIKISESDLLKFAWSYDTVNTSGVAGPKVTRVHKSIQERRLTITMYADRLDSFLRVTEQDVIAETPGKLYIDSQYLACYIISGSPTYYSNGLTVMEVKVVATYPFWCNEIRYVYSAGRSSDDSDYPYDYPYDYLSTLETDNLVNPHYAPTPFLMYVYGPCTDPALYISNHLYQLHLTVDAGAYVIVDSRDRTITLVNSKGVKTNVFDAREKSSDIFAPIPPGTNPMVWDGTFWFDVVLVAERSVPLWTLS